MNQDQNSTIKSVGRREFMRDLAIFSCGTFILGNYGFNISNTNSNGKIKAIVIDFSKCTGCRTCETVCSAYNYPVENKGIKMMGPGNPYKANIQVYHYNPDIDVPSVCSLCPDNPCIKACPVEPDSSTGRKALYKDQATLTVRIDSKRCISCGKCTDACSSKRTGIIRQNAENGEPMGICNLCNGDPKCVKYCTYGTLSFIDVTKDRNYFGLPPQKIAKLLYDKSIQKATDTYMSGYYGTVLDIDLTSRKIETRQIFPDDLKKYIGGRGLAMKLLYDTIPKAGIDPLSADNVLLFMPGPFSGFPIPNSSRTCVVCKSPMTSPIKSNLPFASTVSYSNMGGFFGPELRFAGYDGLMVRGKADKPVYIFIEDDRIEIRDASKYWGMGTDQFDKQFITDLADQRFKSCYIGPAGEKLLRYSSVINTAARAAGRGGTGCVMGSKNLKAVAVRGSKMPTIADHAAFITLLEKARQSFALNSADRERWRTGGTANALEASSDAGTMAVKNYSEASFSEIDNINTASARKQVWKRDFACYVCQLSCKKSGMAKGAYGGFVHDGPEYETGTMLGANLLISDLNGLNKCITIADDYGIDIISLGNVIGFLMEAYDKKFIDIDFLDGIDLKWGSVDATMQMIHKIGKREPGIGEKASYGVKKLAEIVGKDSYKFAIHVKGHELAAWNVYTAPTKTGLSYATANRGACHMNGGSPERQDKSALRDSLGMCSFADSWYKDDLAYHHFLAALTGFEWTAKDVAQAGERIYNLEKMFNFREGFRKEDDFLPERFFLDKPGSGPAEGKNVNREEFAKALDKYYESRGWDLNTSQPTKQKLEELGLGFVF